MGAKQSGKIYYSMGEVTEMFDVNPSLIRFWESKFDILKPHKNKKGNRLFTPADVENLKIIYHLVKEKGMTLEGARKMIKDNREGINRDLEVIDRLLGIKAVLAEIRQELGVGADFREDDEEPDTPDLVSPTAGPAPREDTEYETEPFGTGEISAPAPAPVVEQDDPADERGFAFGADEIDMVPDDPVHPDEEPDFPLADYLGPGIGATEGADISAAPGGADGGITGQVQQIVSQNIHEMAGEELPEEYVEQLSDEIAREAATAAEVREALAELERAEEKKQGPTVYEQTLF